MAYKESGYDTIVLGTFSLSCPFQGLFFVRDGVPLRSRQSKVRSGSRVRYENERERETASSQKRALRYWIGACRPNDCFMCV